MATSRQDLELSHSGSGRSSINHSGALSLSSARTRSCQQDLSRSGGLSRSGAFVPSAVTTASAGSDHDMAGLSAQRKKIIFFFTIFQQLSANIADAVMAPIYPIAARRLFPKVKDSQSDTFAVGMVFTAPYFIMFVCAPLIGGEVPKQGPKRIGVIGLVCVAGATCLFAFVEDMGDWTLFLLFSYLLRFVSGFGTACIYVSAFSILVRLYPNTVSTSAGILETCTGLGFALGPVLGGVLYEHAGFKAAFFLITGWVCLILVAILITVPSTAPTDQEEIDFPASEILGNPRCVFVLLIPILAGASVAFLDPTLGPFLHYTFGLGPSLIGVCFLPCSLIYAVSAPIVGYIADNITRKPLFLLGFLVSIVGFGLTGFEAIFGPSEKLWMVLVGTAVGAIGMTLSMVPVSGDIVAVQRKKGHEESYALNGVVGGLLNGSYAFGLILGPVIGSLVSKSFSFVTAQAYFSAAFCAMALVELGYIFLQVCKRKSGIDSESASDHTPLVKKSDA